MWFSIDIHCNYLWIGHWAVSFTRWWSECRHSPPLLSFSWCAWFATIPSAGHPICPTSANTCSRACCRKTLHSVSHGHTSCIILSCRTKSAHPLSLVCLFVSLIKLLYLFFLLRLKLNLLSVFCLSLLGNVNNQN